MKKHLPLLVWPKHGTCFSEGCRSVAESCMQFQQEARPQIFAVHDDILGFSSLPSQARDAQVGDDNDAIGLCEFLQQLSKQKPCTRQSEIPVTKPKAQPTDATACLGAVPIGNSHQHDVLPQTHENDACDAVADGVGPGGAFANTDLEVGRLKPTPARTRCVDLLEVMSLWHDAPSSHACCPWHNSLRGLNQAFNRMTHRCVHDWGAKHDDHQCPECLRLTGPTAGVCAFCGACFGQRGTPGDGVENVHGADNRAQPSIQLKCTL